MGLHFREIHSKDLSESSIERDGKRTVPGWNRVKKPHDQKEIMPWMLEKSLKENEFSL